MTEKTLADKIFDRLPFIINLEHMLCIMDEDECRHHIRYGIPELDGTELGDRLLEALRTMKDVLSEQQEILQVLMKESERMSDYNDLCPRCKMFTLTLVENTNHSLEIHCRNQRCRARWKLNVRFPCSPDEIIEDMRKVVKG